MALAGPSSLLRSPSHSSADTLPGTRTRDFRRSTLPAMNRSTNSYGSHPSQVGELFLPSGDGPHAVCVVVHGGYWRAQYDRSLMTGISSTSPRTASPPGTSSTGASEGAAGGPTRSSTWPPASTRSRRWMSRSILASTRNRTFGRRPARALGGRSLDVARRRAGCLAAGRDRGRRLAGRRPRPHARGGAHAVVDADEGAARRPTSQYDRYVLASPRERLPLGIPQLVLHGDRDDTVSMRIATSYATAARQAGDPCELRVLTQPATSSTSTRATKPGTSRGSGSSIRRARRGADPRSARARAGLPPRREAPPSRRRRRRRARRRRRPARASRCRNPRTAGRR